MSARAWLLLLVLALAGGTALAVLERAVAPARDAQRAHARDAAYAAAVFGNAARPPALRYERVNAQGYAGDIDLLVAIDASGCPQGVAALRHQESSGYGAPLLSRQMLQRREHGWLRQVLGSCGKNAPGARLDGTTGATITANAVASAVARVASARTTDTADGKGGTANDAGQP